MLREMKRLTVIFIVFLIIFSFANQILTSKVKAEYLSEETEDTSSSRLGIIGRLIRVFGATMCIVSPIIRLIVVAVASDPPIIEIGYNETVNVDLGQWNVEDDDGFMIYPKPLSESIFRKRYLDFQVIEYPGGSNDQGSWFITFNPPTIDVKEGTELKTNVSISLTSPPSASNPIQSGILKIRLYDIGAFRGVWFPPKGSAQDKVVDRFFWFMGAILVGYGKLSGTVQVDYEDVNILVKVKPYHSLKFDAIPLINLNPNQITSIPVSLQNLGNYNDTYSFRLANENDDIKLAAPYSVTLAPGEIKNTYVAVSVPGNIFDYGTINRITIEAYSIDDPNVTIAQKTIYIETKGLYISEIIGGSFIFVIIFIMLGVAFFIHRRRVFLDRYCIKPDKPWEIPEEKKYLEKIKNSDKEKYNEVSRMMEDEYESALLWYRSYCKEILKPKPVKKKEVKKEKIKIKKEKKPKKKEEKSKFLTFLFSDKKEKKPLSIKKKEGKSRFLTFLFSDKKEKKVKKKKEKSRFLTYLFSDKKEKKAKKKEEKSRFLTFLFSDKKEKKVKKKEGKSRFLTYLFSDKKEKKTLSIKKKEEKPVKIEKEAEIEKRRKENVLLRIKREQEKQKRKIRN